jgi:hypothetical protein
MSKQNITKRRITVWYFYCIYILFRLTSTQWTFYALDAFGYYCDLLLLHLLNAALTLSQTALLPPPDPTALDPIGPSKKPVLMTSARSDWT